MSFNDKLSAQKRLINRDGNSCHYCGIQLEENGNEYNPNGISIDHIDPRAKGGSDRLENLVLACQRCNRKKRIKSYQEFRFGREMDTAILFIMGGRS